MRAAALRVVLALALAVSGLLVGALGSQPERAEASMADVQGAINAGMANAAQYGITQYVVIMDRSNGQIVGTSGGNIDTPVASESLVKVMIAAYYLRANGGTMPAGMNAEMWDMIVRSNNDPASKYWSNSIVPTIAGVYGLTNTYNNPPRPGYWGATHVTARDMAKLMWGVYNDPLVAPWMTNAMRNAQPADPDGYNQQFGFNAIDGDHGAKMGWGCDSYWLGPCSIGSIGWSDKIMGAVLQTGPQSAWGIMRSTATVTTQQVVAAARRSSLPTGSFDDALSNGMAVRLRGWALDRDVPGSSIQVAVYRDGVGLSWYPTNVVRGDVNGAYGASGAHGFDITLSEQPGGSHEYCIYAIDAQGEGNPLLGCRRISVGAPFGVVDQASSTGQDVSISGWAVDLDVPASPIQVAIYRDSTELPWVSTSELRGDVNATYGVSGPHGFAVTLANEPVGVHQYCVYGIDPQGTGNPRIGCMTVNVLAHMPTGVVDRMAAVGQEVLIDGWAVDSDAPGKSIPVAVYRDGQGIAQFPTDVLRDDVNAATGATGTHGFSIHLQQEPLGVHQYCVYAIDDNGAALNPTLECRSINVTLHAPIGVVDVSSAKGSTVRLAGWTLDVDSPDTSIGVAVSRDGVVMSSHPTDVARPDVNASVGVTGVHGYDISLTNEPLGVHNYCLIAIDPQDQTNTVLGCDWVNVGAHPPFGAVDVLQATSDGVRIAGWAFDSDAPETASSVIVSRDGARIGSFPTDVTRPDVNASVGASGEHGFDVELTGEPAGTHTYCVSAADDSGAAADALLGCATLTR